MKRGDEMGKGAKSIIWGFVIGIGIHVAVPMPGEYLIAVMVAAGLMAYRMVMKC